MQNIRLDLSEIHKTKELLTVLPQPLSAAPLLLVLLQSALAPFVHKTHLGRRPLTRTRWALRVDEHQSIHPALLQASLESIVFHGLALVGFVPENDMAIWQSMQSI